ncbi:MAG: GTP-binding protein [Oscillospiraceae bacterium]|nr:GTP-binding protein [Oscillospiraceae bacterium]
MEVPVYLITGFLDSGKSTFIRHSLEDERFMEQKKTLLILCEEGEIEFDAALLKRSHTTVVRVEEQEDFNTEFLKKCQKQYKPDRVMIEYNGMWSIGWLRGLSLPKDWLLYQIITTVDATTFGPYLANMRQLMLEKFSATEMIMVNRCGDSFDQEPCVRAIQAVNPRAEIVLIRLDGSVIPVERKLPFDLNAEVVEIKNEDFGVWYIDALNEPRKYAGKTVRFTGMVYRDKKFPKGSFVPGRYAMVCCANDMTFIGFLCRTGDDPAYKIDDWVEVVADIKCEEWEGYQGEGPVLYPRSLKAAEKPADEIVNLT